MLLFKYAFSRCGVSMLLFRNFCANVLRNSTPYSCFGNIGAITRNFGKKSVDGENQLIGRGVNIITHIANKLLGDSSLKTRNILKKLRD